MNEENRHVSKDKAIYSGNISVSNNIRTVDALSKNQFIDYINTNGTAGDIALIGESSTNWQDEIFRSTVSWRAH